MTMPTVQDKQKEIAFFDAHAASDEYDVFKPESNAGLIAAGVARPNGSVRSIRDCTEPCQPEGF